jgi:rare lipoprotein A (peptidoglycan hydrolase)
LRTRDRNCPVLLEYFDLTRGWKTAATGRTDSTGAFRVVLRALHIGRFMFRATTPKAAAAAATSMTPIEIYRRVVATIFGAGDYGSRTACGQVLTPGVLGVAHRTLPCGTPVDITYGSLTITVPVIDRGPFVGGVSYDLTTATAAALGINETAQIGAVAIRTAASPSH